MTLAGLVEKIGALTLSDRRSLVLEPQTKSFLDIYVDGEALSDDSDGREVWLQRIRCYADSDGYVNEAKILTTVGKSDTALWNIGNLTVNARGDCVFVEREEKISEGKVSQDRHSNIDRFIKRHEEREVIVVVLKRARRGNDPTLIWKHVPVVTDEDGVRRDITKAKSVLGICPYLYFSFQDINRYDLNGGRLLGEFSDILMRIKRRELTVDDVIVQLTGRFQPDIHHLKIEVEAKGDSYLEEGKLLAAQLIAALGKNSWEYEVAAGRKIFYRGKAVLNHEII